MNIEQTRKYNVSGTPMTAGWTIPGPGRARAQNRELYRSAGTDHAAAEAVRTPRSQSRLRQISKPSTRSLITQYYDRRLMARLALTNSARIEPLATKRIPIVKIIPIPSMYPITNKITPRMIMMPPSASPGASIELTGCSEQACHEVVLPDSWRETAARLVTRI